MQTQEFLSILKQNPNKEIVFEYAAGEFVPNAYHITEVKNVHIESVDCGGRPDEYYQTVIQLWIGETVTQERAMTADKAMKILDIVDKKKPMRRDTELFFEYGYGDLRTSNYQVENVVELANKIILQMYVAPTVCKPKFELQMAGSDSSGMCAPGGGCC
ncbi:MAG: DUF6428 family protein [Saprospiraceae bacterium]